MDEPGAEGGPMTYVALLIAGYFAALWLLAESRLREANKVRDLLYAERRAALDGKHDAEMKLLNERVMNSVLQEKLRQPAFWIDPPSHRMH